MSKKSRIWTTDDIINYESLDPKVFKPKKGQVYANLPNDIYHSLTDWHSSTLIKTALKSKEHFDAASKKKTETSMPMEVGSAFHSAWENWLQTGELDLNAVETTSTRVCDKWLKEKKENPGKYVIPAESIQAIEGMCIKLEQNRLIEDEQGNMRDLFDNGYSELSFFGELNGIKVKARPDYTRFDLHWLYDWKTCSDARPAEFSRAIANFLYHFSIVFYARVANSVTGIVFPTYVLVAIEKEEPHYLKYYYLDDETVSTANVLIDEALDTIKYGDAQTDLEPISLPAWAKRIG